MSFICGKLESDHEIVQKEVTFGDKPWRKCECCNKWFDKKTGEEVETVETTMGELITQSRQMWMAQMTEGSDSGKAPREWKLLISDMEITVYDESEFESCPCPGSDDSDLDSSAEELIHVIEKSAYDQLAQELDELKQHCELLRDGAKMQTVDELQRELAEARAEIRTLRNVGVNQLEKIERLDKAIVAISEGRLNETVAGRMLLQRDQIIAIYEKALRSYEYVGSKQAAEALSEAGKVTRG